MYDSEVKIKFRDQHGVSVKSGLSESDYGGLAYEEKSEKLLLFFMVVEASSIESYEAERRVV